MIWLWLCHFVPPSFVSFRVECPLSWQLITVSGGCRLQEDLLRTGLRCPLVWIIHEHLNVLPIFFLFMNIFSWQHLIRKFQGMLVHVLHEHGWHTVASILFSLSVCMVSNTHGTSELKMAFGIYFRKHSHSDRNYMEFPKNKIIPLYNCFFVLFAYLVFCLFVCLFYTSGPENWT